MANKEGAKQEAVGLVSTSNIEKRIPKFCNGVLFNKLSDGSLIITFVYREAVQMAENSPLVDDMTIIEKVVVDEEHAKQISEKLKDLTQ